MKCYNVTYTELPTTSETTVKAKSIKQAIEIVRNVLPYVRIDKVWEVKDKECGDKK